MKNKINENELEGYKVLEFNKLNCMRKEKKNLREEIYNAYQIESIFLKEYREIKEEYNQVVLAQINRGKYSGVLLEPCKIKNELSKLEDSVYNYYSNIKNEEREKAYLLKSAPLKEDLESASKKRDEFIRESQNIDIKYRFIKQEYKNCKSKRKNIARELRILELKQKMTLLNIKKLDHKIEKTKKLGNDIVNLNH